MKGVQSIQLLSLIKLQWYKKNRQTSCNISKDRIFKDTRFKYLPHREFLQTIKA